MSGEGSGEGSDDEVPAVELPLDGRLDLHLFRPQDTRRLLEAYAEACRQKRVLNLEIVHGKGTGALQRTVHSVLSRLSIVESFRLAEEGRGGRGVTRVVLKPPA